MRNPFIALAAAAALMFSAIRDERLREFTANHGGWDGSNRKGKRGYRGQPNEDAREVGVPKWLRQHNRRYGRIGKFKRGGSVMGIVKTHAQNPGPALDHWADKKRAAQKLIAFIQDRRRMA